MHTFMVERYLPNPQRARLRALAQRAKAGAVLASTDSMPVEYLGTTVLLEDEMCFCYYEAASEDAVRRANHFPGLSFGRILKIERVAASEDA